MADNIKTFNNYAKHFFKSFDEEPFNEVDSAIFSWMSYLLLHEEFSNNFSNEGMPLVNLLHAEYFDEMLKGIYMPEDSFDLMISVISNPRYRDAVIKYYRYENDLDISLQFSAMVFGFKEGFHYVAYRGTDKTIHGWKEDVKLIMSQAAPGQMMAVSYLNGVGSKITGPLIVGGHSKGGNLAVYASAHCNKEIQDRILHIYSHDGPGFLNVELEAEGMKRVKDRITKNVPTGSVVGIILRSEVNPKYVHSNAMGPFQHFPGTWEVELNSFLHVKNKKLVSNKIITNINKWAESVSDEELVLFMNTLFEIVESAGVNDLDEILSNQKKYLFYFVKIFYHTDTKKKNIILKNFMDALNGRVKSGTDDDEYNVDWDKIENIMNEYERKQFDEGFDLFL